jgi:3-methylfumaryl-CoA hydratase
MTERAELQAWIGRTETRSDFVAAGPIDRLAATLDRHDPPARPGEPIPPLAHWLFFLPDTPQSELGPDGHPARGGFLPPVHDLPRRMWAGGRLHLHAPIRVGTPIARRSTIAEIAERAGGSGPLVFVTVRHEVHAAADGTPLLVEEQDIVYRGAAAPAARAAAPAPQGAWQARLVPDAALLFRYSALTFNGHRIHYDLPYVTEVEHYPGLIVHGPLIATLLMNLLRRTLPGAAVTAFSFRALSPLFAGNALTLHGTPPDAQGQVALWAANDTGGLAMRAEATIRADDLGVNGR